MKNIYKILIGAGVVTVGAVVVHNMVSKKESYISYSIDPDTKETVYTEKEDSRIKMAAEKKATEILAFVVVHREQIEAVGTVIGLVGGAIGIVNAFKEYRTRNDDHEMLKKIVSHCDEFELLWNRAMDGNYELYTDLKTHIDDLKKAPCACKGGKK